MGNELRAVKLRRPQKEYIIRNKTPVATASLVDSVYVVSSAFRRIRKTLKFQLDNVGCRSIEEINSREVDCLRFMIEYHDAMNE